jgi:hypothetical protein
MDTEITRVIFRVWVGKEYQEGGYNVIALFPDEKSEPSWQCMSYAHIGQHGGADYAGCIRRTRPAKPAEYAELAAELKDRGYNLKVCARR